MIGFNILGGLAGRGQEILSIHYYNTPETDRYVMVQDGQLLIATLYHKSQNVMDCLKVQAGVFSADK